MAKRYELLDMNHKLIWNFRDISHTMRRISGGKGSQKRILIVLNEEGVITQRELTEHLGIQPGSASEVIGKLEAAGMLIRTPSQSDRRTMDVALTEKGRREAGSAGMEREQRHKQMFSCLSEEEKESLLSILEKVNCSWNEQYQEKHTQQGAPIQRKDYEGGCRS